LLNDCGGCWRRDYSDALSRIAQMEADGTLKPELAEEARQEERRRYTGSPVAVSE